MLRVVVVIKLLIMMVAALGYTANASSQSMDETVQVSSAQTTQKSEPAVTPAPEPEKKGFASLFGTKKTNTKFLPVTEAFKITTSQKGEVLTVYFDITPNHYIYKDKVNLILPDNLKQTLKVSSPSFNQTPTSVDDPEFGRVLVFEKDVVATFTLKNQGEALKSDIRLSWQGCAKAGLCYPPERTKITIELPKGNAQASVKTEQTNTPKSGDQSSHTNNNSVSSNNLNSTASNNSSLNNNNSHHNLEKNIQKPASPPAVPPNSQESLSSVSPDTMAGSEQLQDAENQALNEVPQGDMASEASPALPASQVQENTLDHQVQTQSGFGLERNPVLAVFLLFLAGIGLAFTACVYPMIPIVANIVAKSHKPSAMRGFVLTLFYGLGVATSYGLLGAVIAWAGRSLGIIGWLQNPVILLGFAAVFVVLGLSMLGVIRLRLPQIISRKLSHTSSLADRHLGSVGGSFVVGSLSALVVSPCVSAPLAGALTAVAASGNVVLGFVALFALGLGLSSPLMLVGALEGKFMPKAGVWMESVKVFAGLMLFLVAILLLNRVVLLPVMLIVWAVWFAILAVFFWRLNQLFFKAVGLVLGFWSGCLMVGFGLGESDAWQPLKKLSASQSVVSPKNDKTISTLGELDEILKTTPKVLVEVTADWCIECRIMEKTLFTNRPAALSDWQVVKLDVTDTNDDSRAILERYQLFGPPALLYYKDGKLSQVQLGEVGRAAFEMALVQE